MASETISLKCATNDDQNSDPIDCTDSPGNASTTNRDSNFKVTKSWSPIAKKQCRCSSASGFSRDSKTNVDKKSLYRTYSSYGFKYVV